ncbi:MAG: hypothetical protein ACK5JM_04075 [Rhodoblastus sp.]
MSYADLDPAAGRAGRLDCVCAPGDEVSRGGDALVRLTFGFGLAILAQTLVLAALPVASLAIAPRPALAGLPYALTLLGAALATFPASFLLDAYGRRAAFGLGASLGAAGGALAAWSAMRGLFAPLCVGAFWLGLAHGFALFYRHAAAAGAQGARGGATVFAGGALAALFAPGLLLLAGEYAGPFVDAAALAVAGLVDLLALLVAVMLPHALAPVRVEAPAAPPVRGFVTASLVGAAAWFVMTALMARAAPGLAACGVASAAVGGVIAWHLVAMYAPAAIIRLTGTEPPPALALGGGLAILACGALFFAAGSGVFGAGFPGAATLGLTISNAAALGIGLACAGVGWSLANAGLMQWLYGAGAPTRLMLALHDCALLTAALAGALAAPLM